MQDAELEGNDGVGCLKGGERSCFGNSNLVLSTAYLPNIEYTALLSNVDTLCLEACETYQKQTYRNRCRILTANGVLDMSIPVVKVEGNGTMTKDIRISYSENWQRVHWGAICSAYNSSPYFMYYRDLLEPFYVSKRYTHLLEFNTDLLGVIFKILGWKRKLEFTTDFVKKPIGINDLRYAISPKKESAIREFESYEQVYGHKFGFESNLSIIDLIFNMGPESRLYIKRMKHG